MSGEKILSISIAAYNVENYIDDALASLANPEYVDYLDVIIVDDGSMDKTASIASRYVSRYPESFTLISKENAGYGSTVNCALRYAKGKYFKLLDGDDWYQSENMAEFLMFLQQTDTDMVLCEYQEYDCDVNHPRKQHCMPYELYVQLGIDKLQEIRMYELAVKTELVRERITITEHCYYTDVEWFIKAALCCKTFIAVPLCIYCYRMGREGQSVSFQGYIKHIAEHEYIIKSAVRAMNENECLLGLRKNLSYIIISQYYLRLQQKRIPANLKKLLRFHRFVNEEASFAIEYMSSNLRFLNSHPFLLLMPFGIMRILSKIMKNMNSI